VPIAGQVKWFSNEEGWGVLTSPDVPGDVFVHFSDIPGEGYRSLSEGQKVLFDYEDAVPGGQDGCPYVATNLTKPND
jgi:CspA family cold shock protein